MPNKNFSKFPSSGPKKMKKGDKDAMVGPIKTKNWPGIPGKTQPKTRNFGFRKVPGGAAEKGV